MDTTIQKLAFQRELIIQQQDTMRTVLRNISILAILISLYFAQKFARTSDDVGAVLLFELSSTVISICNIWCVRHRSLRGFQIGLVCALQQCVLWAQRILAGMDGAEPWLALHPDQWPLGSVLFFLCWGGDRFLMGTLRDTEAILEKLMQARQQTDVANANKQGHVETKKTS
ncbi:hypothetical protein CYMTET_3385 [Cymbomonas tetramitiformis]|uniref:Uncharacterized protein n=1 Tax=Cymbomonas tetramitiformis TaxID=36881 RepID=A0AAE0LL38_9CHLO|nr:hypothetical protein CYMTET_3385 [Cymbomonas tetramitiformis]